MDASIVVFYKKEARKIVKRLERRYEKAELEETPGAQELFTIYNEVYQRLLPEEHLKESWVV